MYITNGLLIATYTLWSLLTVKADNSFTLDTPIQNPEHSYTKLSNFGYSVASSTCIILQVKVCLDAHIALMTFNDELSDMYEIIIGGWGNQRSVIRKKKGGPQLKTATTYNIMNCNEYKKLKIGWRDNTITIYMWKALCQWEVLMSLQNATYPVNYIGVSAFTSDGKWIIHNEGCSETNDNRPIWKKDMTKLGIPVSAPTYNLMDSSSLWKCAAQCQRFSDCCFFNYDETTGECLGYSSLVSSGSVSGGKIAWKRL